MWRRVVTGYGGLWTREVRVRAAMPCPMGLPERGLTSDPGMSPLPAPCDAGFPTPNEFHSQE